MKANGDGTPRSGTAAEDRREVADFVRFGDEVAFRSLYRRHTPPVYRLIARLVGAERSADDALQMAWIRVAENLHRFRWESSLRSWITGIAINCCRELIRKERRLNAQGGGDAVEAVYDHPRPTGLRIDLERAIAGLPTGYREVLILHDVEGYTHLEIAEMLGVEAGTSKSQLSRARRALRKRLNTDGPLATGDGTAETGAREVGQRVER